MAERLNVPSFMISTTQKSEFHQTCVPVAARKPAPTAAPGGGGSNQKQAAGAPPVGKPKSEAEYRKCDVVTQDEIWKQAVNVEKKGAKQWEDNWGFLTEYDAKGRPKSAKSIPEEVNMYSDNIPNTNAGNYGSRLNTELGQMMQNLEFRFHGTNRKKRLGNDLVCY